MLRQQAISQCATHCSLHLACYVSLLRIVKLIQAGEVKSKVVRQLDALAFGNQLVDGGNTHDHRLALLLPDVVVEHTQVGLTTAVEAGRALTKQAHQWNLQGTGQLLTELVECITETTESTVLLYVKLVLPV